MQSDEENLETDLFQLYDLKVEVVSGEKPMVCDQDRKSVV